METSAVQIKKIFEGEKQYIIPLFQRSYTWQAPQWREMLKDILDVATSNDNKTHFMGPVIFMPTKTVPEGVSKFLVIDGQQRLTTLSIILNIASKLTTNETLRGRLADGYCINKYAEGNDRYKLLPSNDDREPYFSLVNNKKDELPAGSSSRLGDCGSYFYKELRRNQSILNEIIKTILERLELVSITLGDKDNPYNVFASLNSKGLSLTESDLIKNYLFMKVDQRNQEEVYAQYWKPMEAMIGENMSEFIRHFLMSDGVIIAKNEVYNQFRSAFEGTQILDLLKTLNQASKYYYTILNPETITSSDEREIKLLLVRVSRLKLTVVYPFYLRLYMLYGSNRLAKNKFIEILRIVENLLVRRLIAGEGIKGLNKELPMLCAMASQDSLDSLPERIKNAVTTKSSFGYISDNRLTSRLLSERLYRSGEQSSISKLVLEEIDKLLSQEANERIDYTNLTVEHIMPQKLSDAWREDLTEDDINQHEDYLHTIGNLTLTGLNEKMGNGTFKQKKIEYQKSALKLNAEIISNTFWTISQIKERSQQLSQHIITLWPNLKQETTKDVLETDYTWKRITHITISGTQMPCESWRSALVNTVNYLLEIDKDQLMSKLSEYFVNETEPNNGKYSKLNNGYYINTNYNANSIVKLINRFAAAYDIPEDEITFEVV